MFCQREVMQERNVMRCLRVVQSEESQASHMLEREALRCKHIYKAISSLPLAARAFCT